MFEATEGTVQGVNANDKGVGFTLKGQEGWFNFSKFLPREHQEGLTIPKLPPEDMEGKRVRFLFEVNKMGKRYIQVNADGSHELTIMDTAPPSQNGESSYDPDPKSNAILWAVCLKLAGELYIARCNKDDARSVATVAVLHMAWGLFQGGPSGSGEPIKAETARVMAGVVDDEPIKADPAEFVREVVPVTPQERAAALDRIAKELESPSTDGDPGPEYEQEGMA